MIDDTTRVYEMTKAKKTAPLSDEDFIKFSPSLWFRTSFVTTTHAILGKKRAGKSYKASVIAEEMLRLGKQIVVIDPTSAWWGLRSSADGHSAGYPITIFGGEHGDLPLEPEAAADIADAIIEGRFSAILDLSELSRAGEQRFCADFLDRFYRKNPKRPVHVFLDEADVYAPQAAQGDEMKSLSACRNLVLRGGIKGIGITMITQRPARLNKDVLSQIDCLTAIQLKHPADLDQVENWVKRNDSSGICKEMMASLPTLPKGEAWVWNEDRETFDRVTWNLRRTFDSGRTPDADERIEPPTALAKVDLERLGEIIRGAAQKAKDNDPKELKKRIAELDTKLRTVTAVATTINPDQAREMDRLAKELAEAWGRVKTAQTWNDAVEDVCDKMVNAIDGALDTLQKAHEDVTSRLTTARNLYLEATENLEPPKPPLEPISRPVDTAPRAHAGFVPAGAKVESIEGGSTPLSPMERAFLTALAQYGALSKGKVLLYTGYAQGGATSRAFAHLTKEEWIRPTDAGGVVITDRGFEALGHYERLPRGERLRDKIRAELDPMQKAFFDAACAAYPLPIGKGKILEITGYAQGGATSRAFAYLCGRDWLKSHKGQVQAAEELFR